MRKTTPEDIAASRADFAELAAAVARLRGPAEVARFLEELYTPSECVELSKRWALMRELLAGKSQRAISRELGLSLCKITRGAKYARDEASLFRKAVLAARHAP
ncbi:MAG: transcriptional regulator [Kiritimatiellae bacterium]|nr:transcriptional regulator [Kiritimatiellia bacterium]